MNRNWFRDNIQKLYSCITWIFPQQLKIARITSSWNRIIYPFLGFGEKRVLFSRKILNETEVRVCVCVKGTIENLIGMLYVSRYKVAQRVEVIVSGVELRGFRIVGRPTCSRSAVVNRNRTFMIYPFDRFGFDPLVSSCKLKWSVLYLNFH